MTPVPDAQPSTWDLFRKCRALAVLPEVALREVFAAAEARAYQAGDALVTQGDPAEGLLILLEGSAHARLRRQDGAHTLGRFTAGDIVGEMALVTHGPRTADVIADSAVRALLLPTATFDALAVRHLQLSLVLTTLVADRLGQGTHDGFGGKSVAGFRIMRCIGRGGMSVVYQAQDETSGEVVALKMMSYRLIYDAEALARFHQESDIHQSLEHENIARLKRLLPAYRTYFLVMELCDGMDLRRIVKLRGGLPEPEVRAILGQLAQALEYVHGRGLVHRDLKPANVLITREGRVKLTDFGLAMTVVIPEDDQTRAPDRVLGTPAFMAPEQLTGGSLDRRTDVYGLGCLAYELLTGSSLFVATNTMELMLAKATVQLPPASEIGDGISPALYAFLRGALNIDPDQRPSSLQPLVTWAAPCEPPPAEVEAPPARG